MSMQPMEDNFLCNLPTSQRHNGYVDDMFQGSGSAPISPKANIEFKNNIPTLEQLKSLFSDLSKAFSRDTDHTDEKGCTLLYKAASRGQLNVVKILLATGEDPNKANEDGRRALHVAAEQGYEDIIKFLVDQGADVNAECDLGQTPLHAVMHIEQCISAVAAGMGYLNHGPTSPCLNIVKYLIEQGSKIDKQDHRGYTPLHIAAAKGHLEIVKYLTDQKCYVKEFDNAGLSPLDLAAIYCHLDTVKYLADGRADETVSLCEARASGHFDNVKFFVDPLYLLRLAAHHGFLNIVQHLVQQGVDVNSCDEKGWTPLEYAIQKNNYEVTDYLLTNGAKANQCNEEGPLYMACRLGHLDAVNVLISRGISVNSESHRGQIPLHAAAITGRIQIVEALIENGSDLNKTDIDGCTPLHAAVQNGHLEVVSYLIWKGAIDIKYRGMTSFYTAAQNGHLDIVDLLLSNGADVNEEDDTGRIALHAAAANGSLEIVEKLINHGSNVNKMADNGWTPLHAAVYGGGLNVVRFLISHGAKKTRFNGMTVLYIAAQHRHTELIRYFATTGCDVNDGTDSDKTPLLAACYNGDMNSVQMLVTQGACINQADRNDWTPVHAAAQEGHLPVVNYLVENGADTNAKDRDGMTPLQAAEDGDNEDVQHFLFRLRAEVQNEWHNDTDKTDGMTPLQAGEDTCHEDGQQCPSRLRAEVNDERHKDTEKTDGMAPLQAAEDAGHQDVQKCLIQSRTEVHDGRFRGGVQDERHKDTEKTDGMTPLQAAVDTGHEDVQQCLIRFRGVQDERQDDTEKAGGITQLQAAEDAGHEDVQQCLIRFRGVQDERQDDTEKTDGITSLQAAGDAGHEDVQKCLIQSRTEVHDGRYDDTEKSCRFDGNCQQVFRGSGMLKVPTCDRLSGINGESYYPMLLNVTKASISTQDFWRKNSDTLSRLINTTLWPSRTQLHHVHGGEVPATGNLLITDENGAVDPKPGTKTERRNKENCFSIPALLHRAILALVFYFSCFPILVAGNLRLTEPVTLEVGTRGVVKFYLQRPFSTLQFSFFYEIQFGSKGRAFCTNGQYDVAGFKDPSQVSRFTTTVLDRDASPFVNMTIDDVHTIDGDQYILTAVWHSGENVVYDTQKKEVFVQRPPGRADCFITLSDSEYPYEVHCWAKTGSIQTTLACYQNDQDLAKVHNITDNGQTTRAIFFLPDTTHFSCCSHDIRSSVDAATCNDFEWPPGYSGIPSTGKATSRSKTVSEQSNRPADSTPPAHADSDVGSGARRSFMVPSHWHFLYLLMYSLVFVINIIC